MNGLSALSDEGELNLYRGFKIVLTVFVRKMCFEARVDELAVSVIGDSISKNKNRSNAKPGRRIRILMRDAASATIGNSMNHRDHYAPNSTRTKKKCCNLRHCVIKKVLISAAR